MKPLVRACFCALVVQPFILLLWVGLPYVFNGEAIFSSKLPPLGDVLLALLSVAYVVVIYAAGHMLLLGLPLFYLLRYSNRINWISSGLGGFVSGCLPTAIFSRPSNTGIDWPDYFAGVVLFGLHGIIGALVFYWAWRTKIRPNNSFNPNPHRGSA
jgi:hypothetical protein